MKKVFSRHFKKLCKKKKKVQDATPGQNELHIERGKVFLFTCLQSLKFEIRLEFYISSETC